MTALPSPFPPAVRLWLWSVAALVFATVLVGGATRLTESGLSIVEWRPVTGALPPLSQTEWRAEFEKYQTIPQFKSINSAMRLEDFKTIYWWEWTHRLLGRVIGAAFLLPFLWFMWRGAIPPPLRLRLWAIFALGAAQGSVGWWMVASGLADRVSVSPYRLSFHLTLACAIYAALVWTVRGLAGEAAPRVSKSLRYGAFGLLSLVFLQIYVGGLVAGLDAGMVHNTWPLIDGAILPASGKLLFLSPAWRNLFENDLTVQFTHRFVGYALWLAAVVHAVHALCATEDQRTRTLALVLAGAVTLQAGVGIVTLLLVVPIGLALAHQAGAIIVLTVAVMHAARLASGPKRATRSAAAPNAVRGAG